ncbi:MAG: helix-turn-helix transcriptional regulator [Solirubrobacteraceae bacterium]
MPRSPTPQAAVGRAIGLRRRENGLSQEALADAAGISERGLRDIETGTGNPTWHVADRIARALGWSIAELALRADELETVDRRPTNQPLRKGS